MNNKVRRRGSATETIIKRYNAIVSDYSESGTDERDHLIDETRIYVDVDKLKEFGITKSSVDLINNLGYIEWQVTENWVMDRSDILNIVKRHATSRVVHNSEISGRGDAGRQEILSYKFDLSGNMELVDKQEIINYSFDSLHNVKNQSIRTYDVASSELLEVQEIRNIGAFHPSGATRKQIIATFTGLDGDFADVDTLLDIKVVENISIGFDGNVKENLSTTYNNCLFGMSDTDNEYLTIMGLDGNEVERQYIRTIKSDLRGNALQQHMIKEYWESELNEQGEAQGFKFSEAQYSENDGFNIFDQASFTRVIGYSDADYYHIDGVKRNWNKEFVLNDKDFTTVQDIFYEEYDKYGNVLKQVINTYDDQNKIGDNYEMPLTSLGEIKLGDMDFVDHKYVENEYGDNAKAMKRGNPELSTVKR